MQTLISDKYKQNAIIIAYWQLSYERVSVKLNCCKYSEYVLMSYKFLFFLDTVFIYISNPCFIINL